MNGLGKLAGAALLIGGLGGCSAAHIALSPQLLAVTEPVALTGMGYGEAGHFALAASSGDFRRKAMVLKHHAPFPVERKITHRGGGSFSVSGPDFTGELSASCRYIEEELRDGALVSTVQPFRYHCSFARDGQPIQAEMLLMDAPRSPGKFPSGVTRVGQLRIGGATLTMEPIHEAIETQLPSGEPLGYRFVKEGRDIGAIDLNGESKTVFAPREGPDREMVLIGSLALSILWYS